MLPGSNKGKRMGIITFKFSWKEFPLKIKELIGKFSLISELIILR